MSLSAEVHGLIADRKLLRSRCERIATEREQSLRRFDEELKETEGELKVKTDRLRAIVDDTEEDQMVVSGTRHYIDAAGRLCESRCPSLSELDRATTPETHPYGWARDVLKAAAPEPEPVPCPECGSTEHTSVIQGYVRAGTHYCIACGHHFFASHGPRPLPAEAPDQERLLSEVPC